MKGITVLKKRNCRLSIFCLCLSVSWWGRTTLMASSKPNHLAKVRPPNLWIWGLHGTQTTGVFSSYWTAAASSQLLSSSSTLAPYHSLSLRSFLKCSENTQGHSILCFKNQNQDPFQDWHILSLTPLTPSSICLLLVTFFQSLFQAWVFPTSGPLYLKSPNPIHIKHLVPSHPLDLSIHLPKMAFYIIFPLPSCI